MSGVNGEERQGSQVEGKNSFWKILNTSRFKKTFDVPPSDPAAQKAVFEKIKGLTTIKDSKVTPFQISVDAGRKLQKVLPLARGFGFFTEKPVDEGVPR